MIGLATIDYRSPRVVSEKRGLSQNDEGLLLTRNGHVASEIGIIIETDVACAQYYTKYNLQLILNLDLPIHTTKEVRGFFSASRHHNDDWSLFALNIYNTIIRRMRTLRPERQLLHMSESILQNISHPA